MSMHNQSEASFERINKSVPTSRTKDEPEDNKSRKRCIIIVLLVCVLAAAITALILVLIFKGGSGTVPKGYNGYTVQNSVDGKWYFEAILQRTLDVKLPVDVDEINNPEFRSLRMRVSMINDHTYRMRINPVTNSSTNDGEPEDIRRWEVPKNLLGNVKDDFGMRLIWGNFKFSDSPAGIELSNPLNSGVKYVSTMSRNLVFTDKYLEQGFLIDSRHVFGFGERQKTFELNPGQYSSWANGRDNHFDAGELGGHSYGDHPFVLARLNDNTFVGIFFLNSNAKELEYRHVGRDQSVLNFKAIGGLLDFFTFFAETPEEVIKAYHGVIGKPYLPPFWALGFQQSSWQYNDTDRVNSVLRGYDDANMPLEALWLDIEYMDAYRNFLVNTTRFSAIPVLASALHNKGQKLVTIVDAGFAASDDYTYYKQANEQGLFIKSTRNNDTFNGNLIGDVWPGKSAFIDFTHPDSTKFWVNGLKGLYSSTLTDAIWIDMNEITSFCNGECPARENPNRLGNYTIPYNPLGNISLEDMGLSIDGQHHFEKEEDRGFNTEYNMHSLYATLQANATQQFWIQGTPLQGRRPFVLSRSSFAGAGKYTSHWLGDNWSSWSFMQFSIAGIMDFNMFGMPLVGADVCGFHSPYEDEMCGRWMQLSTFYPFARNHYNLTDRDKGFLPQQEPYLLKAPWNNTARLAIVQRYQFLRYFYTLLFETSKNGGTMVRPLFWEFPEDDGAYQGYEHSFMVGKALKVSPVLRPESEHKGKIESYFPAKSRFISLNDWTSLFEQGSSGANKTLTPSLEYTIVHQKEGTILPFQPNNASEPYEMRTRELFSRGISLVVFPDTRNMADGTLFLDEDGDDAIDIINKYYQYYGIRYRNGTFSFSLLDGTGAKGDQTIGNQVLEEITILNMPQYAEKNLTACVFDTNLTPKKIDVEYVAEKKAISISAFDGETLLFKDIGSIQFSDADNDRSFCTPHYVVTQVTKIYANENVNLTTQVILDITAGQGSVLPDLQAKFSLVDDEILRVEINNPAEKAFKAPKETFDPDFFAKSVPTIDITSILTLPNQGEDFYYEVHEFNNAKKVYYSTKNMDFVYSTYYKRHAAVISSSGKIWGLGERVGDFFLGEGVYTIWARDEPSPPENGKRPGNNIYGAHPIYFTQTTDPTMFFAVFDHNAGAQDYIISKGATTYQITQIKTSGVTDKFILLKTGLPRLVNNYQRIVGKPIMVPEWGLGWHQCRYGYNNTDQVDSVVKNYIAHSIPLDVMWTDIDYMEQYRDFTLSRSDFKDLPDRIKEWRKDSIRYIPILDAAVAYQPGIKDSSYERGRSKNVFIKDGNDKSKPFIGKVWPGPAVYIDWLKDGAETYWTSEMSKLHDILPYDGMWIDMNEASNFCDGYCTRDQRVQDSIQGRLFYTPGARDLNVKSISIDALHADGTTEFEAHSTYGFYMSKATSKYFTDKKERPFVITRSTYAGVGKYVSHWLGDNFSRWDMLKYSVGGIFNFGMFGVPVAGADICGFIDDTWPTLCARWYALGAFYPFSRNHNDKSAIPQEPYVAMFANQSISGLKDVTYTDFIREMALKRYAIHRYQYSWTHKASSSEGTPYFAPLFYYYSDDPETYKRVEYNVMLGDSVKLSAMVADGTVVTFYFPEKGATWCPIWPKYQKKCFKGQSYQELTLPLDESMVHIKSGSIVPLQLGDLKGVSGFINLENLKSIPLDLAILCDSKYAASGWVRYDDGLTMDLEKYTDMEFTARGANPFIGTAYVDISISIPKDDSSVKTDKNQNLGSIVIYNASQFSLGKSSKIQIVKKGGDIVPATTEYDGDNNICRFHITQEGGADMRQIQSIHVSSK